jgi:transposase
VNENLQQTLVELSERHQIDPNQLTEWKKQLLEHASDIFSKGRKPGQGPRVEDLHARRGQLSIENDYISGAVGRIGDASAKRRSTRRMEKRWHQKAYVNYNIPNFAHSPNIRKFVNGLPGLGAAGCALGTPLGVMSCPTRATVGFCFISKHGACQMQQY